MLKLSNLLLLFLPLAITLRGLDLENYEKDIASNTEAMYMLDHSEDYDQCIEWAASDDEVCYCDHIYQEPPSEYCQ